MLTIYKKVLIPTFFVITLLSINCAYSTHTGKLEYNDVMFDYSKLDKNSILNQADKEFSQYNSLTDEKEKENLGRELMGKYYILTRIEPEDIYPYVQLARLYIDIDKRKFAREYLSTALNIDNKNPYTNYYYGEYFYKYKDYRRALRHYLIAYNNGYQNEYDLNLKMAIIYEKFGDLTKSTNFYKKAQSINPQGISLTEKIQSLENLNYGNSEYYSQNLIRE